MKLNDIFNKTEILRLHGDQKLAKFIDYMSEASNCNMTITLSNMHFLIIRWFDAHCLLNEYRNYKVETRGPFTESAQHTIDTMILNATDEYNARNYEAALQKLTQVKEYIDAVLMEEASYWREQAKLWQYVAIFEALAFILLLLYIVLLYRRKLRHSKL